MLSLNSITRAGAETVMGCSSAANPFVVFLYVPQVWLESQVTWRIKRHRMLVVILYNVENDYLLKFTTRIASLLYKCRGNGTAEPKEHLVAGAIYQEVVLRSILTVWRVQHISNNIHAVNTLLYADTRRSRSYPMDICGRFILSCRHLFDPYLKNADCRIHVFLSQ